MNVRTDDRGVPESVKLRTVIEVIALRGRGTPDDVVRRVRRYHDPETGELLAEGDPAGPGSEREP